MEGDGGEEGEVTCASSFALCVKETQSVTGKKERIAIAKASALLSLGHAQRRYM